MSISIRAEEAKVNLIEIVELAKKDEDLELFHLKTLEEYINICDEVQTFKKKNAEEVLKIIESVCVAFKK